MDFHRNTQLPQAFADLDVHALNLLLQQEVSKPTSEINEEKVLRILSLLEQKEIDVEVVDEAALQAACEKYRVSCKQTTRRKSRKMFFKVCAAAAILCVLLTAIPRASGESLLSQFFKKITEEVVAFFCPDQTDNQHEPSYETAHPGLQKLYDEVSHYGIESPIVPSWIPEEYKLVELQTESYSSKSRIYACFEAENKTIMFYYDLYGKAVTHEFLKDDSEYEKYETAGIKHFIFKNNVKQFALWEQASMKCSIVMDCQEENLIKILDSIYNMEDL